MDEPHPRRVAVERGDLGESARRGGVGERLGDRRLHRRVVNAAALVPRKARASSGDSAREQPAEVVVGRRTPASTACATVASGSSGTAPVTSATVWPLRLQRQLVGAVRAPSCRRARLRPARLTLAPRRPRRAGTAAAWDRGGRRASNRRHDHRIGVALAEHTGACALAVGIEGGEPHEQSIGVEPVGDGAALGAPRSLAQPGHCGDPRSATRSTC